MRKRKAERNRDIDKESEIIKKADHQLGNKSLEFKQETFIFLLIPNVHHKLGKGVSQIR